ncbi:MAG TPA: carboxymuconolactone decarboxylase family protein [Sedimentisphaerales bacterium]|nr:carboxymuconolactone decarboxylase family protein [Sedimentisphaerales bacterium]
MNAKEFYANFPAEMEKAKLQAAPIMSGFGSLFSKCMAAGAMTVKEKELVAVGIAVALRCEPCIFAHAKKCLEAGATREQIIEAAGVAVVMAGGPAYMHVTAVIDALDALDGKKSGGH